MNFFNSLKSQQSKVQFEASAAPVLCWQLEAGHSLSVRARQPGFLKVRTGRVWATLDGPHVGTPNDWGDLFLQAGQGMHLRVGQRLVMEPAADPARAVNVDKAATHEAVETVRADVCVDWQVA